MIFYYDTKGKLDFVKIKNFVYQRLLWTEWKQNHRLRENKPSIW
jgi:hypothetical protein